MRHKFKVTGLGLKVDGVMIMPGSDVELSAKPPSHWQRFGEIKTEQDKPKQEFEVASPSRRGRPRKSESTEE